MARRTENRVELIGIVGQAPALTPAADGNEARTTLSIATHTRWRDGEEVKENTEWTDVVAFGKLASEVIAKLASQGAYVRIVGRLRRRKVETDGQVRYYSNVIAEEFFLLDKREDDRDEPGQAG